MKKRKDASSVILLLVLIIGLSLLLYPTVSNYWNSRVQSHALSVYQSEVAVMDTDKYRQLWEDAKEYNEDLLSRSNVYLLDEDLKQKYNQLLDVGGTGIMGYIEIQEIAVNLPIYHGTSEGVLQVAIGHLEWTSLPTGGAGTHCVISGHRGLPSAKLFTDLDRMAIGDTFMVHVLDETLTYEVDQVLIVNPDETETLMIEEGKDLFTLVTCTPYGVNSHRLLVRGHRVENAEVAVTVRVTADALEVDSMIVACVLVGPILLFLMTALLIFDKLRRK